MPARVLERVVFQGGTALRLCYGAERYSEYLDFVCGAKGGYIDDADFGDIVQSALESARQMLAKNFGIVPDAITVTAPANVSALRQDAVAVATWQMRIPVEATARAPRSSIKVEFANVPSYDNGPAVAGNRLGLPDIPDIILRVESPNEILADKAVALTARPVLKYRDIWDVWFLRQRLTAGHDRTMVAKKFADYRTADAEKKARGRIGLLTLPETQSGFVAEMSRFLPLARIEEMRRFSLPQTILAESAQLLRKTVSAAT